jgi:hypothetical protein
MKSSLIRFSFARVCVVSMFFAASGLAANACGGDDNAQTTTTGTAGTAGDVGTGGTAGSGGSAGSGTGGTAGSGGGAGGGTGGSAGAGTGGTAGSGGTGGTVSDGGAGSTGADAGEGGVAMGKKTQAFAIVSAGNVSKSANYTLVSTMSQGPGMNGSSKSTNFRLNLGVVGATQ